MAKGTGNGAGRPQLEISKREFEALCKIQCTRDEIMAVLNISRDTLLRWCKRTYFDENGKGLTFEEVFEKFKLAGKPSLRRKQFKLAEKSATMAIWLGKQYLGQKDEVININKDEEDDPLTKSIKEALKENSDE